MRLDLLAFPLRRNRAGPDDALQLFQQTQIIANNQTDSNAHTVSSVFFQSSVFVREIFREEVRGVA